MSNKYIHIFENTLTSELCDDIIEKYKEECNDLNNLIIRKREKKWNKIETLLYTQLLTHINKYKSIILQDITDEDYELIKLLNQHLYLKDFIIKSKLDRLNNRYNVICFVFCLNTLEYKTLDSRIVTINPGSLIIYPDDMYSTILLKGDDNYLISGELSYKNINDIKQII